MKDIPQKAKFDTEKLKQILRQQKTTKKHFKIPLTEEQIYDILLTSYITEVEYRNHKFIPKQSLLKNISELSHVFAGDLAKFGVMLCGRYGNGKTTLLQATQTMLIYLTRNDIIAKDYQLALFNSKDLVADCKSYDTYKKLRDYPLLGIDDMGREPIEIIDYGNILSPIIDILEYRYDNQLFTILTTNLNNKEIKDRYKTRLTDRFNEMLEVIIFEENSFRGAWSQNNY